MIIDAITIETTDIEKLRHFYQQALKIDNNKVIIHENHEGLKLENTYLGFDKIATMKNGGNTVIWFKAKEVSKLYNQFLEAGAKPNYKPNDEMSPGETLASVFDIDGNRIGIIGPVVSLT